MSHTDRIQKLLFEKPGLKAQQIATELGLSANTVGVHRANIMDRLGIHKTAELVVYAIRNGLVTLT